MINIKEINVGDVVMLDVYFNEYEDNYMGLNEDTSAYSEDDLTRITEVVEVIDVRIEDNEIVVKGHHSTFVPEDFNYIL